MMEEEKEINTPGFWSKWGSAVICGLITLLIFEILLIIIVKPHEERSGWNCNGGMCAPNWQQAGRGGEVSLPQWEKEQRANALEEEKLSTQRKINELLSECKYGNCRISVNKRGEYEQDNTLRED